MVLHAKGEQMTLIASTTSEGRVEIWAGPKGAKSSENNSFLSELRARVIVNMIAY